MRLAAAYVPVLCVLFALHGARARSEAPPVVRSTYCDGQGAAERLGFDMGCPAYAIPETLNSEKFPATTCSSIIENYSAAPDGPYWFRHPVTGAVERKWCLFGDGLGPRFDMGRTEITFVTPEGYNTGLTPMSFGSSIDYWTKNATSPMMLRSPQTSPSHRGWVSTTYIATDAFPLRSWAEGALGLLNFNVGLIKFTADAPVVVRMYNVKSFTTDTNWDTTLTTEGWRRREDLQWCHALCGQTGTSDWRVYEQFYLAGTHELDTTEAAYQFFTPANGILPGSDQPAELESAIAAQPPPTTYRTPRVNVSAPGYAAGLTPYDFGGSVDFWTTNLYLRYPKTSPNDRGWNNLGDRDDLGYIATDADPLPSWSEGALGLLSVDAGTVEFTTDEPVVVRLYNTELNYGDTDHLPWTSIDDMMLWRRRNDLAWCNAWQCAPRNDAADKVGTYWVVWERYFPKGTHALDTTEAAYQFFTPANGTLPGSDQPAELESAAYMDETPGPDYETPTVNVSAPGYAAGLTPYDFGGSVDFWTTNLYLRYPKTSPSDRGWNSFGYVATDADPLPSWSEGALGLLSVDVGTVHFTTDEPVVVRLYNTEVNYYDTDQPPWWTNIDDMMLWRRRNDLAWCNAWQCAPRNDAADKVGTYWVVWERYFPKGTHALDTTEAAYQFFTPANGTLPGSDQPAELESAAYMDETPGPDYETPTVNVSAPGYAAGLTPYDFGGSVDFWTTNLYLRYPKTSPSDRGWNSFGYVATDADPLPSWSEGALGLLSVDAGTVHFTTDEPVVVRLYNTEVNYYDTDQPPWWTNIDDMMLWRRRNDLAWCNAWQCAPRNDAADKVGTYWVVWERYFPKGTHALDTTEAAYQFFTPANGTLPGSDQPAELESAAYMDETPGPDYETPTVNVSAPGYAAGLTPYDFGGSVDFWTTNLYLRYPKTSPSDRGWNNLGDRYDLGYIATDADPLPSWSEGALGLLSVDAGTVHFTTDEPVVVRLYNTQYNYGETDHLPWTSIDDMMLWRRRNDLAWCNAWQCAPRKDDAHRVGTYWVVWERYFPKGTHALDTTMAAYQFFTPANGTLPGSDQPAELESAAYMDEKPRPDYETPTVNVSAPGYAAGLTPYDFGGSVDFWTTNLYLRYPKTSPSDRGWNNLGDRDDLGYIATDADPLPSWSEGALGLLSVDVGTVHFTTDAPVVVRLYNTQYNYGDTDDSHWTSIDDMMLWRRRNDLAWCNAWQCAPRKDDAHRVGTYWVVWERYFPKGTHALDTTQAAYQFFTPANGTLPGSDQPAELESAAYMDETPRPDYETPTVSSMDGHTLSRWNNDSTIGTTMGTLSVSSDLNPLPSWSEGALGLLSVDAGTVHFTTDEPVVVRLYNTQYNYGDTDHSPWTSIDDMMLWRRRNDLAWCNAWQCAPRNDDAYNVGKYWVVWERYFPEGTHALDTTMAAYQFFTPANGTLPGSDQPADLQSAAAS